MKKNRAFDTAADDHCSQPAASLSDPIELPADWFEHVAGGLNPQPLPPYHEELI
jgi:hypothetical protein